MKRVPGYTIPMVPMHLPPMAPMNLVEQIRALHKNAIERRFTAENAIKGAEPPRAGPDGPCSGCPPCAAARSASLPRPRPAAACRCRGLRCERRGEAPCATTDNRPRRICSTRFIGATGGRCIGTIGMVHPGTLFIGDSGAFLCIPMKIGVKSEHWRTEPPRRPRLTVRVGPAARALQPREDLGAHGRAVLGEGDLG
jgi:hypothetical protein